MVGVQSVGPILLVGTPKIVNLGTILVGKNCKISSGPNGNPVGGAFRTSITVTKNATLTIGDNTGISNTEIYCSSKISIGDNVFIGGGVRIYDTNFHSLNPVERLQKPDPGIRISAVEIGNDAFIGAFSIILKGVTVGAGSVIGAGSVVSSHIPPGEIWAGNPVRKIRNVPSLNINEE